MPADRHAGAAPRRAASSCAAGRCPATRSRSATRRTGRCPSGRSAGSASRPEPDVGLLPQRRRRRTACCSENGWLDTGDLGYLVDGAARHHRPQQGPDHRRRPQHLAAGPRVGGRASRRRAPRRRGRLRRQPRRRQRARGGRGRSAGRPTPMAQEQLRAAVAAAVRRAAGVECEVVLAPTRSLTFTTSGKLSRAAVKADYLERRHPRHLGPAGRAVAPCRARAARRRELTPGRALRPVAAAVTPAVALTGAHRLRRPATWWPRCARRDSRCAALVAAATPRELAAQGVALVEGDLDEPAARRLGRAAVDAVVHVAGAVRRARRRRSTRSTPRPRRARPGAAAAQPGRRFVQISSLAARQPAVSRLRREQGARRGGGAGARASGCSVVVGPPARRVRPAATAPPCRCCAASPAACCSTPARRTAASRCCYAEDLARLVVALLAEPRRRPARSWSRTTGGPAATAGPTSRAVAARARPGAGCGSSRVPQAPLWRSRPGWPSGTARATAPPPILSRGKVAELYHGDWVSDTRAMAAAAAGWRPRVPFGDGLARDPGVVPGGGLAVAAAPRTAARLERCGDGGTLPSTRTIESWPA